MKSKVVFLFALSVLSCGDAPESAGRAVEPGEGFYRPETVALPRAVEGALRSVVRVAPDIRYRLTLFAEGEAAARARSAEGAREKEFLPQGGVVWPVLIDTSTIVGLCGHPAGRMQPGFKELCDLEWRSECDGFPCTLLTDRMTGSATGVAIRETEPYGLLIATNYHVAREVIERHGRTDGLYAFEPVPATDVDVAVPAGADPGARVYQPVPGARLLANASEAEWQQGQDWAILAVPAAGSVRPVPLASTRPKPGDTLWSAGFPIRTVRASAEERGYPNAASGLRVSVGTVVAHDSVDGAVQPTDIVSTLDAVPGSSGSPVFNRAGEVVGLVRHHTCTEGEIDVRIQRYCGYTTIVPIRFVRRVLP